MAGVVDQPINLVLKIARELVPCNAFDLTVPCPCNVGREKEEEKEESK